MALLSTGSERRRPWPDCRSRMSMPSLSLSSTRGGSRRWGRPPPGRRRRRRRPTPGAAAGGQDVRKIRPLRALADAARVAENVTAWRCGGASARGARTVCRGGRRASAAGGAALGGESARWPAGRRRLGAARLGGGMFEEVRVCRLGFGFGVSGFPRCRHKERVTVLFYCTVRLEFVHV